MAKKKTTLGQIGAAIADAATTVVHSADKHVVQPVGDALGLTDDKKDVKAPAKKAAPAKPAAKSAPAKPAAKSVPSKPATPKAPTAKKPAAPAAKSTQSTAKKILGSVASKVIPKETGPKPVTKTATKKKG